jgi:hypothetical protein
MIKITEVAMSKETSIEWLVTKIINVWQNDHEKWVEMPTKVLLEYAEQAKEMEKEQIMEAHGDERDYLSDSGNFITISAEQYYNETYKQP